MLLPFSRRPEGNGLALGRFSVIYATPPCVITRRSPVQGSRAVPEHLCLIRPYVPKARTLRSQPPRPPAPRRKLPRGRVLDCPPPRQHGSARRSRAPGNGGSAAQIFTPLRRHPGAPTTVRCRPDRAMSSMHESRYSAGRPHYGAPSPCVRAAGRGHGARSADLGGCTIGLGQTGECADLGDLRVRRSGIR